MTAKRRRNGGVGVRRFLLVCWIVSLALSGVACGKAKKDLPPPRTPTPLDQATLGTISGVVLFNGTPPPRRELATGGDAACASAQPRFDERIAVHMSGGRQVLQNAFVWIKSGLTGHVFPVPAEPAVIDQKMCVFEPHVTGVQRHQWLVFKNSDPTEHNVNFVDPGKNPGHNMSMTGKDQELRFWFPEEAVMMKVICNKHSWMTAYIGCCDHPYFAVTGPDGSFDLRGVPPGTYTVACWSEAFGVREQAGVQLDPKGTKQVEFSYTIKE